MAQPNQTEFVPLDLQVEQRWDRLAAHLAVSGHLLDRGTPPRQFAGGFGNLNFKIILDGKPAVLRRPPLGIVNPGSNDMMREGRILTGLHPHFPLAPKCLHLSDDVEILGAPFLIMEYRRGLVIGGALPEYLRSDPTVGERLTDMLIYVLSSLHAVDPQTAGLASLGRPDGYLMRTANGWAKRAQVAWDGSAPEHVVRIMEWLEHHPTGDRASVLLHNDFKLDNMILTPGGLEPKALIDWDLGTRGDPLWDLAVLLSYWTEPCDTGAMASLRQMPTGGPGFPSRRAVIERYSEASGNDVGDIRQFRVVAQFRLAVVFRQIFRRYRDSEEGNPRVSAFDTLADGLMDFAVALMEGDFD